MNQIDRVKLHSFAGSAGAATIAPPRSPLITGLNLGARAAAESLADRPISPRLLPGLIQLLDTAALALIGVAAYAVYVAGADGWQPGYLGPLLTGAAAATLLSQASGSYALASFRRSFAGVERVAAVWSAVFAAFTLAFFFTKSGQEFSRVWVGTWYLAGLGYFAVERALLSRLVKGWARAGRLERRAVIVGGGAPAANLISALETQSDGDIRICGIFDDRADDRSPPVVAGYPKLGTIAELLVFCRIARIDLLIVALPISAENRLLALLKQLWVLPIDIRLSAHANKLKFRPRAYSYLGGVPFLDVFDRPIADWDSIAKRCLDVTVASLALVLLSPLLALTAIAIKLDSRGPVLFRQRRYGFNNEVIEVLKFRSLRHESADPTASKVVTRGDSRVTRVGRFIRRTSIDELPQLVNVLRGTLSLVGPRPHAVQAATGSMPWERLVDGYFARHRVKPGVTGWAQVCGWRGEVDTPEKIQKRVECDLHYIENWSILFDLYVLALTPFRLFNSPNAY
ncbi:MAG: undecaprenyl-phosphate glucose phosphotransferase [Bauldia sp.]